MESRTDNRQGWRSGRLALLAVLLPLTLVALAQTGTPQTSTLQTGTSQTGTPQSSPTTAPATMSVQASVSAQSPTLAVANAPTPVVSMPASAKPDMVTPGPSRYLTASGEYQNAAALPPGFDVRQFEAMAQALVSDQRVPGMAMAIVQDGRILSARGYGITDVSAAEPVNAHTVFRLASLSKAFASTMTGLLVSEGALRWDSKLVQYMPGFELSEPGAAKKITVADLLSHRVGLPHNSYDRAVERYADYRTLVHKLDDVPLKCEPGTCYAYQNVAFSMIGDVVFAATGHFYSQSVERRLFKPLGMNDASLGLDGIESSASWARPHVNGRGGWVSLRPKPTYYHLAPAAGVNASASDMAQWLLAQSGHRPDVVPAPLLATLHNAVVETPWQTRNSNWRRERLASAGYGLGWRVYNYAGHRMFYHAGAVQGYRSMIALLPDRDLGVVVLWNGESSLPSGLMPTIIDRAIGMTPQAWLDEDIMDEAMYAYASTKPSLPRKPSTRKPSGSESDTATAAPQ